MICTALRARVVYEYMVLAEFILGAFAPFFVPAECFLSNR
jgi:hypothetical protein